MSLLYMMKQESVTYVIVTHDEIRIDPYEVNPYESRTI